MPDKSPSRERHFAGNEGVWDRVIRILAGIALGYAAWMTWPGTASLMSRPGAVSLVFLVIGAIAFVTGLVGCCPVYALFDVSTKKRVGAPTPPAPGVDPKKK